MAEFEEEAEELSNEEKLKIAKHYLLSSPPGQFQEVLTEVKKLVPEEVLPEDVVNGIARVANLKSNKVVTAPSGKKVVISSQAEVEPNIYFDPVDSVTFALNHLTLETSPAESSSNQDQSLEHLRAGLQQRLQNYIRTSYTGDAAVGVFANDGKLSVAITGEKTNLKNFWSGKWNSTWSLIVDGGAASISGEVKIHVHYFEDGNLQMQTNKSVPATTINFDSESSLFDKVANFVQNSESSLQNGLEEMYTNMNNETFRAMRRVMAVTRTKMDWNVNSVRMVRQVRK